MKLIENWFSERYSDNLQLSFRVSDQLLSIRTDYQRIDVFETYDFGKLLSIDGTVQLTERDEYVYHEMITMMPYYHARKRPENVLVIGGGDGGVAGELLKLGIKKIVNVEIDGHVVEVCRKHFPQLSSSFDQKGVNLIIGDGIKYVKETKEKFDMVIVDSTDPEGPAEGLFGRDFYSNVRKILSEDGIVVAQTGSPYYQPRAIKMATDAMKANFQYVITYTAFIPTYPSGFWSFTMAAQYKPEIREEIKIKGKYFNEQICRGSTALPQFVLDMIT
ncbi:polyamine aminopropyltransferase [Caldiplasma sukawensis]